jgi:Rrf2 family protein
MLVSTRGRYALQVLIDLTDHNNGEYTPLRDIAKRQDISEKYLENILPILTQQGFLETLRGKCGGYRLAQSPETITAGTVLKLTEQNMAAVACPMIYCTESPPHSDRQSICTHSSSCKTLPMWQNLQKLIDDYFSHITIADLSCTTYTIDYVI